MPKLTNQPYCTCIFPPQVCTTWVTDTILQGKKIHNKATLSPCQMLPAIAKNQNPYSQDPIFISIPLFTMKLTKHNIDLSFPTPSNFRKWSPCCQIVFE